MDHSWKEKAKNILSSTTNWLFSSSWPSATFIFLTAFLIRYQKLLKIPRRWLAPNPGWEMDSIAISLVKTGEFANPYMIPTGPTAHLPPLHPWLISLIYRAFGLTEQGGFAAYLYMVLTFSLMFALLPWLGEKLGLGRPAGLIGGLIGALSVEWAGHGEYLTGIGLSLLLVFFLLRWKKGEPTWWTSILLGLFCGLLFHLQPALLLMVIGCLVFEALRSRSGKKRLSIALVVAGIFLACLPWGVRNYQVMGGVFFIRSNFGLELRLGNHDGAAATMEIMDQNEEEHQHPRTHLQDARLTREVGEVEYMRLVKKEALDWIQKHPGQFIRLLGERFINLWFGPPYDLSQAWRVTALTLLAIIGIWSYFGSLTPLQRAGLLIPVLTYPLVYYVVAYMPRYRIPIDGLIYLLSGAGVIVLIQKTLVLVKGNLNSTEKTVNEEQHR